MKHSYYEDVYLAEQREAEWRMLNTALRERRSHSYRRSFVAAVFWIFGIRS